MLVSSNLQAQTEPDEFIYLPLIVAPSDGSDAESGFPAGTKIMPLGDSRVQGNPPAHESYRYELWKNLIDNGWTFDFVGTRTDGASYDDYTGQMFDIDHEGTSGATTTDILNTLDSYQTDQSSPEFDVVLLGIGGNDLLQMQDPADVIVRINQIIDDLQAINPDVVIFVEQIAPGLSLLISSDLMMQFAAFNGEIATLAVEQTNSTSTVIAIDMNDGWSDAFLADPVHYNAAGAKFIADKYDAALEAFYSTDQ
ncbi:MAG: GDSL-type esterase/lipase family protein [Chloroflexota bacterium]